MENSAYPMLRKLYFSRNIIEDENYDTFIKSMINNNLHEQLEEPVIAPSTTYKINNDLIEVFRLDKMRKCVFML